MSSLSLYQRIVEQGTKSDPEGKPDPRFALPSTVNWMRGLAILLADQKLDFNSASSFYAHVGKRRFSPQEENTIFEQLLFGLHQLSALEALKSVPGKADVARVAIVAWYYGIYSGASAMIAAQDGSFQEDHSGTANVWDTLFAAPGKVLPPFSWRVSSLVERTYKAEVKALSGGSSFALTSKPTNVLEAQGACCAYLSGCAAWWKWKTEDALTSSREFKQLNVSNFRSKAAKELRDARLGGKSMSFLHQAIRYRGKANYREALFLGYGRSVNTVLDAFVDDLAAVLRAFLQMSGAFARKRLGQPTWQEFVDDLEAHRAFQVSTKSVWG